MRCPKCGGVDDRVVDSRVAKDGTSVRRRRVCEKCDYRFSTVENIVPEELTVIKRNGVREIFDRDKLRRGIECACYKRPVSPDRIDRAVDEIAIALLHNYDKEVPSGAIGEQVMSLLRGIDQVAYVRFASVYRKFADVEEFIKEIRALK